MPNTPMSNDAIAETLSLYAKLMDIHGQDAFRAKSYANAAFQVDRNPNTLAEMSTDAIAREKGIGASIAAKISDIITTGTFSQLDALLANTPEGILQMMQIKGLGAKKIAVIWKEMGIESPGELLYACQENRLVHFKGFGAKTQQQVQEAIEFMVKQTGKLLLADVLELAQDWEIHMTSLLPNGTTCMRTSGLARGDDTLDELAWVIDIDIHELNRVFSDAGFFPEIAADTPAHIRINHLSLPVKLYTSHTSNVGTIQLQTTMLADFRATVEELRPKVWLQDYTKPEQLFTENDLAPVPAYLQTLGRFAHRAAQHKLPDTITTDQIRGIIHAHSTYSDGADTLEFMARSAKDAGFEYLVITDHSKSAFYAGGLQPDKILAQHAEIDQLNAVLAPFKIFKSIESDILHNGNLDYETEVLASFDLVIGSIHSGLKMDEEKAMGRLLAAIENPFTTIIGHPTGRLLLSRKGYPVNHKTFIAACVANKVVIEINAHPRRLDLDWSWIPEALDAGAMLSINPDAHWVKGFDDIAYGVLAARKGGLTASSNLSSLSLVAFEQWLVAHKKV